MMQTADLGYSNDGPERRRLNAPWDRSVPIQGEVGPRLVVVADILLENPPEMVLAENDEVVKAISADGSDRSLALGFPRSRGQFSYAA